MAGGVGKGSLATHARMEMSLAVPLRALASKEQWQAWIVYQRVVTTVFKREIARCMMRAINADRTLKRVTVGSIHCARRQARNAPDRSPFFER